MSHFLSHRITLVNLIELHMLYFDMILGMDGCVHVILLLIVELDG